MTNPILVLYRGASAPAAALLDALAAAVERADADAAVAVRPVTDALKRVEGDRIVDDVDRDTILLPVGPVLLRTAPARVDPSEVAGDPDAAITALLAAGARVVPVLADSDGGPV
jgi:hypothetical protein